MGHSCIMAATGETAFRQLPDIIEEGLEENVVEDGADGEATEDGSDAEEEVVQADDGTSGEGEVSEVEAERNRPSP